MTMHLLNVFDTFRDGEPVVTNTTG
jgi:hypothetical protein